MKKRFLSASLAVCMACLLTMTSCSAADAAVNRGTGAENVTLPSAAQEISGFSDVPAGAGYAEAVAWCRENGVMNGVSETEFDPDGSLTRSMLVTALYRAEGEPAVIGTPTFTDTVSGTWYSDAVVWAESEGLVRGYGDGRFGTEDPVSVEQMEVILGRYLGGGPEWVGDPAKAHPATRAQVATAIYEKRSDGEEQAEMNKITVSFGSHTYTATLADNSSAEAFAQLLESKGGSMTIRMSDYGSFEKVGPLGTDLPRNDEQITTSAGDVILYQGNQITVYYAQNSWNFTRLGRLDDPAGLRDALGGGDVDITFALAK